MTTKPYPTSDEKQAQQISEPVIAYVSSGKISLSELAISTDTFAACINRAEDDFANGRYFSSSELRRIFKEKRGWK